jgi:hypothetical protein
LRIRKKSGKSTNIRKIRKSFKIQKLSWLFRRSGNPGLETVNRYWVEVMEINWRRFSYLSSIVCNAKSFRQLTMNVYCWYYDEIAKDSHPDKIFRLFVIGSIQGKFWTTAWKLQNNTNNRPNSQANFSLSFAPSSNGITRCMMSTLEFLEEIRWQIIEKSCPDVSPSLCHHNINNKHSQ